MSDPKEFWKWYRRLPLKAFAALFGGVFGCIVVGVAVHLSVTRFVPERIDHALTDIAAGVVGIAGFFAFVYFNFLYRDAACPNCNQLPRNILNLIYPISPWCRQCGKRMDGGPIHKFRRPNEYERRVFNRLTEGQFDGQQEIIEQLKDCTVQQLDERPVPSLKLKTSSSAIAKIRKSPPTEGTAMGSDGREIEFLLHVQDGKVSMLEIVTYNFDGKIDPIPVPEQLELFQPYSPVHGVPR